MTIYVLSLVIWLSFFCLCNGIQCYTCLTTPRTPKPNGQRCDNMTVQDCSKEEDNPSTCMLVQRRGLKTFEIRGCGTTTNLNICYRMESAAILCLLCVKDLCNKDIIEASSNPAHISPTGDSAYFLPETPTPSRADLGVMNNIFLLCVCLVSFAIIKILHRD